WRLRSRSSASRMKDEITSEDAYLRRREFLKNSLLFAATAAGVGGGLLTLMGRGRTSTTTSATAPPPGTAPIEAASRSSYSTDEKPTSYLDVTTYNNFYDFGT